MRVVGRVTLSLGWVWFVSFEAMIQSSALFVAKEVWRPGEGIAGHDSDVFPVESTVGTREDFVR